MTRRVTSALLAAVLAFAPFRAWAQVGRVAFDAPIAPAPTAAASALGAGVGGASAALTPALASSLALTPALAAPAAMPLPLPVAAAPVAKATASPMPAGAAASRVATVRALARAADRAAAEPETIGALYDSAPAGPDFAALSSVKAPEAPAPWRPASTLLKPAAAAVNSWRAARHEKRLNTLGPSQRVATEELGMREGLSQAHVAISQGRLQDALEGLTSMFTGALANGWYRANSDYQPYQAQGHAYIRFIERAVKLAYERAHGRSRDASLIAEARAAARSGRLLGHEWRITAIQERDSAHCAHHALYNAISASVGFAYPLSIHRFVERARETLNVRPERVTSLRGAELAAFERGLGVKFGVDVGEGMGTGSIKKWAQLLGLSFEARGPPRGDAHWSALLGNRREVLISLRMFHERFKHSPQERELHGHDYEILHHEVYLLGAFDSPSRGVRLYMVQDSGSGSTDFYTAEELTAAASELQLVGKPSPVSLP